MTLTNRQLEMHKTHLTASQIPTILGENPFSGAMSLFLKKTGQAGHVHSAAMGRGHLLEEVVAKACMDRLGFARIESAKTFASKMVERGIIPAEFEVDGTIIHRDYHNCAATIDYIGTHRDGTSYNYEIKTSSEKSGWVGGTVPLHYWIQVQWQIWVLRSWGIDIDKTAFGALISSNFDTRCVEYQEAYIPGVLDSLLAFQASCDRGEVPELCEEKRKLPLAELDEDGKDLDIVALLESYDVANEDKKRATANLSRISKRLCDRLEGYRGALLSDGTRITRYQEGWRNVVKYADYCGALETLLRQAGRGEEIDALRKEFESSTKTEPRVQVKRSRK